LSDPHCIIAGSPLNFADCFHLGVRKLVTKTWCNIAAPSILSSWAKRECNKHMLHHFAIWQRQMHPVMLRDSKKSRIRMKVSSTTRLSFPTLSPLLTVGKNTVRYFLDIPHMSPCEYPACSKIDPQSLC
jgi:hypothetical protein